MQWQHFIVTKEAVALGTQNSFGFELLWHYTEGWEGASLFEGPSTWDNRRKHSSLAVHPYNSQAYRSTRVPEYHKKPITWWVQSILQSQGIHWGPVPALRSRTEQHWQTWPTLNTQDSWTWKGKRESLTRAGICLTFMLWSPPQSKILFTQLVAENTDIPQRYCGFSSRLPQ